jgi:hypothetical protein
MKTNLAIKKREMEMKTPRIFELDIFEEKKSVGYFSKLGYFMKAPVVKFFHSLVYI